MIQSLFIVELRQLHFCPHGSEEPCAPLLCACSKRGSWAPKLHDEIAKVSIANFFELTEKDMEMSIVAGLSAPHSSYLCNFLQRFLTKFASFFNDLTQNFSKFEVE